MHEETCNFPGREEAVLFPQFIKIHEVVTSPVHKDAVISPVHEDAVTSPVHEDAVTSLVHEDAVT